ncbi:MAG: dihydroorotase [Elusimicrobiota bacterium]
MKRKLLIKNGRVIDAKNNLDQVADVLIEGEMIARVGKIRLSAKQGYRIYDASGKVVVPGLMDMHVHLREPGREDEETIASGTASAAIGGMTAVCCMPNTNPVIDSVSGVRFVHLQASREGLVHVFPIGSITKDLKGQELSEIGEMVTAGIVAISDDGQTVMDARVMRRAMEYARTFNLLVISHCEEVNLSEEGVMNEGYTSTNLGLKGIPHQSEEIIIARDIALAELTGVRLHIAHLSTREGVELVRRAKSRKLPVTAETCPHYFCLTEEAVVGYNTLAKVKPPLRTKDDLEAIHEGLADGTIDCIASDHAPHLAEEKAQEFSLAPFGMIGLETMVSLSLTKLVQKKILTLPQMIAKFTVNPCRIVGLPVPEIKKQAPANLTIIDLNKETTVSQNFVSKSKNSSFIGWALKGAPVMTIVNGKIVMEDGKLR